MRIDQLMAYSWKILLPLVLLQILVNGAVLVYDWPLEILLVTGLVGVAFLFWITGRAVRRAPRPQAAPLALQGEAAS
jgi:predicted permease